MDLRVEMGGEKMVSRVESRVGIGGEIMGSGVESRDGKREDWKWSRE